MMYLIKIKFIGKVHLSKMSEIMYLGKINLILLFDSNSIIKCSVLSFILLRTSQFPFFLKY